MRGSLVAFILLPFSFSFLLKVSIDPGCLTLPLGTVKKCKDIYFVRFRKTFTVQLI
jgi:hypothetical protein